MSSQPTTPSNAPRYLFLFLLGLVIGIIGLISDLAFKMLNRRLFAWSSL